MVTTKTIVNQLQRWLVDHRYNLNSFGPVALSQALDATRGYDRRTHDKIIRVLKEHGYLTLTLDGGGSLRLRTYD